MRCNNHIIHLKQNVSRINARNVLYIFVRANIVHSVEEDADFGDLDRLSAYYRESLGEDEEQAKEQTLIPGLKPDEKTKNDPGALNDWYDPCAPKPRDYGFGEFEDD